jgi:hypothetical protein
VSVELFVVCFLFGAAGLAMWIHVRFPSLAPTEMLPMIMHLAVSIACARFALPVALERLPALAGVILAALPVLTYILLATLWFMKQMQGALAGRFR